jgi:hypothetical protein
MLHHMRNEHYWLSFSAPQGEGNQRLAGFMEGMGVNKNVHRLAKLGGLWGRGGGRQLGPIG